MTTNKPASRKWTDIQMFLAAAAMALTLGLWNLFAGPDRALAAKKSAEVVIQPPSVEEPAVLEPAAPASIPQGKIMLGGQAPQTEIIVTNIRGGGTVGNGGGGGGGNGGTGSS